MSLFKSNGRLYLLLFQLLFEILSKEIIVGGGGGGGGDGI